MVFAFKHVALAQVIAVAGQDVERLHFDCIYFCLHCSFRRRYGITVGKEFSFQVVTAVSSAQFEVLSAAIEDRNGSWVDYLKLMTLTVTESFNFTLNYIIIIPKPPPPGGGGGGYMCTCWRGWGVGVE